MLELLKTFKPCKSGYQLMRIGWKGYLFSIAYPSLLTTKGIWHEANNREDIECSYIRYYTENGKVKREYVRRYYKSGFHVFHTVKAVRHLYKRYKPYITRNGLISPEDLVIVKVETGGDYTTGLQLGHRVTVCSKRRYLKEIHRIKEPDLFN